MYASATFFKVKKALHQRKILCFHQNLEFPFCILHCRPISPTQSLLDRTTSTVNPGMTRFPTKYPMHARLLASTVTSQEASAAGKHHGVRADPAFHNANMHSQKSIFSSVNNFAECCFLQTFLPVEWKLLREIPCSNSICAFTVSETVELNKIRFECVNLNSVKSDIIAYYPEQVTWKNTIHNVAVLTTFRWLKSVDTCLGHLRYTVASSSLTFFIVACSTAICRF
ncbi:hypothetical protein Tsp_09861 [Trichinella spiralis]|uniref:hypothetical protein n=1 Tax=Trichinella spiralis TaxID=6334 RepID=UPI0001EFDC08|nr:hypothetical protein Tsp_09861 [Trichinella spiralis]